MTTKKKSVLKDLNRLIKQSSLKYSNEFVWQDVELTEEFQNLFSEYLKHTHYTIDFYKSTSVITSPSYKYIFVPNQWFVIASYAIDVYEELCFYKDLFRKVSFNLGKRIDEYAKYLRDNATHADRNDFMREAEKILREITEDQSEVFLSAKKIWRFATDYSWWSGQKTIDRADFYVSVILNMLNLVNTSQGYVADIVNAYVEDNSLSSLVRRTDAFTVSLLVNMSDCKIEDEYDVEIPDLCIDDAEKPYEESGRISIKIKKSKLKEINFKK